MFSFYALVFKKYINLTESFCTKLNTALSLTAQNPKEKKSGWVGSGTLKRGSEINTISILKNLDSTYKNIIENAEFS